VTGNPSEAFSYFCTRCGGEAPNVFPSYLVQLVPATLGRKLKSNSLPPIRYRKAGMCRRCTLAIQKFIEESWHGENRDQQQ